MSKYNWRMVAMNGRILLRTEDEMRTENDGQKHEKQYAMEFSIVNKKENEKD